ncbi:C39 family peptidase [Francisella frigiditurris]|uniref:Peptidase n=1 Tax=Francisella frigiditurris TaxID=1542390 RepID=A0A1J0KU66_9GAMM|nr:C39 family peptidase [Francisella frigiditurris]APC97223.1 peptidase [Francisella frigiditurris]
MIKQPKFSSISKIKEIAELYNLISDENIILLDINHYKQSTEITCGPAATISLLNYYELLDDSEVNKQTELEFANDADTGNIYGTRAQKLAEILSKYNLKIHSGINGNIKQIRENIEKGIPTLVNWFDWGGHWALAVGYQKLGETMAEDKDLIFLIDPASHHTNIKSPYGLTILNPSKFEKMWIDSEGVAGIYITAIPETLAL